MFKRLLLQLCALIVAGGMSATTLANVPAPPVNQNIGIPDGVFNDLVRENCWYCHIPVRLTPDDLDDIGWTFAPPEVKPGVITDRHHFRVGTVIQDPTDSPFGVPGENINASIAISLSTTKTSGISKSSTTSGTV